MSTVIKTSVERTFRSLHHVYFLAFHGLLFSRQTELSPFLQIDLRAFPFEAFVLIPVKTLKLGSPSQP